MWRRCHRSLVKSVKSHLQWQPRQPTALSLEAANSKALFIWPAQILVLPSFATRVMSVSSDSTLQTLVQEVLLISIEVLESRKMMKGLSAIEATWQQ